MTLKRRLSKVESAVDPGNPGFFTVVYRDEAGITRDKEGNIITGQLSGTVIVLSEKIRGA
jgi:hypothetical protein